MKNLVSDLMCLTTDVVCKCVVHQMTWSSDVKSHVLTAAQTSDRPNMVAIFHLRLYKKRHVMSRNKNTAAMSLW